MRHEIPAFMLRDDDGSFRDHRLKRAGFDLNRLYAQRIDFALAPHRWWQTAAIVYEQERP